MQINRRFTNGLAWAGLILVVGVPTADFISGRVMGERAPEQLAVIAPTAPTPAPLSQRPDAPEMRQPMAETPAPVPAKPAAPAVVPAAVPVAASSAVVDNYLSSGKKLPSYITGGDPEPAQTAIAPPPAPSAVPAPVVSAPAPTGAIPPAPQASFPTEMAAVGPQKVAPIPMPLSMRPVPQLVVEVPADEPLILPPREAAGNRPVTADDLEDWESGPLSEFLAERQGQQRPDRTYDSDGYFLSDGPNERPRRDRVIGPADDGLFYPFVD